MQTVSENWKNAHRQTLLNESYVEVSLDITDRDARANASYEDNGAAYISDTSKVVSEFDKNIVPYCTLEQNLWVLDGGRKAIPESAYGETGYVGNALSDDKCVFTNKIPTLTINFTEVFRNPIPGVTITWSPVYGEFADNFMVTAYSGDTIVAQKEVIGNRSVKSLVWVDIPEYNRIVIQVKKWCLPYHRARVEEVLVGVKKVYSKTELFDYSHTQSVDPISTSLPKMEIKFSVDNVGNEYNPYNEQGLAKYLMERQEVKSRYGLKLNDGSIEWIKGGTFYLSEWNAKQNGLTAEFTARDLLEFMSDIYEDTSTSSTDSLYTLAEKVLRAANLPLNSDHTVKWVIDESLKNIYTGALLPRDTLANCLQMIANASLCVLYQDRNGTLHIEPLKEDITDYKIDLFNSYSKSEITMAKPIKQVIVKVYTYLNLGEEVKITTSNEVVDVGTIGETITIDNPIVTSHGRARNVAQWMFSHLRHRVTLDSSWRADVRLDALDIVTNENNYNTNKVRMTDVEFKFNGAFRGTGEGKVI